MPRLKLKSNIYNDCHNDDNDEFDINDDWW